jgi:hypothetical protein
MIHPSAVTVLVTRRIKHGCGSEFEHLMQSMMLVASDFPGHLGGQLVKPSLEEPGLYHVVFAFDSDAHLQNWQTSPARSLGLAAIEPLTEGPAQTRQMIGMAHWFMTGQNHLPPPRWKVAVVTWMGIFPTVLTLFILLGDLLAPWPLVPRVMLLTLLVVTIMTWVVAPQLTRLLKPWLHSHTHG